jgi:hypothetical protein
MTVDHLNRNHFDNRRENLEVVSSLENNIRQHRYNEEERMRQLSAFENESIDCIIGTMFAHAGKFMAAEELPGSY